MKKNFILPAAFLVSLALTGCSSKPQLVSYSGIEFSKYSDVQADQLEQRIVQVLKNRSWKIKDIQPGAITASQTRFVKNSSEVGFEAVIRIRFDNDSYNIEYVDSTNLDYNPKKGTIHNTYNRWVANIKADIDRIL